MLTSVFDDDHLEGSLGHTVRSVGGEFRLTVEVGISEAGRQCQNLLDVTLLEQREEGIGGEDGAHDVCRPTGVEVISQIIFVFAMNGSISIIPQLPRDSNLQFGDAVEGVRRVLIRGIVDEDI